MNTKAIYTSIRLVINGLRRLQRQLFQGLQLVGYSLLFSHLVFIPYVHAGPTGGAVTGGSGNIIQNGLTTTINQTSSRMAIDWQSYNVAVDERVQYIQPNSSSFSLNRILSNNGSTIAGQIDANGHVILVNPNGIFFTSTAQLNVGGIIASGLDINTSDFLNGDYIFNEVLGTNGAVVNSGTINAALGGNVALIGRSVENNGLISANLGTVNLAAGKQAVLTFDNSGLLGVRVSQEILQNELGVDAAVLNSGDINAAGGRVLLTGSVSRDVFSQAVNSGDLLQATSVVVNADGTFSLGAGADVLNSGTVNVSSDKTAGQIVLLGENVTSSGVLQADGLNAHGGNIELHAQNTSLLTQNSVTSARAEQADKGGNITVLGNRVGIFDNSTIDASGAEGGGQIFIGGDYQGKNNLMPNAQFTFLDTNTKVFNNALFTGDGGKTIIWADNTNWFNGTIFAQGGSEWGNGGFVEVSGKQNLFYRGSTNRTAVNGQNGVLLLDPRDITIGATTTDDAELNDRNIYFADFVTGSATTDDYVISATKIETELQNGNVVLQANRYITVSSSGEIIASAGNTSSLTLQAGDDLTINSQINLQNGNLVLTAGSSGCSAAATCVKTLDSDLTISAALNTTGSITLNAADNVIISGNIGASAAPSSLTVRAGDSITVNNAVITQGQVSLTASDGTLQSGTTAAPNGTVAGNIDINNSISTQGGNFTASTSSGTFDNNTNSSKIKTSVNSASNTVAGDINITANIVNLGAIETTNQGGGSVSSGGNVTVTANSGDIVQASGANTTDQQSRLLSIAGNSSFSASSNVDVGVYDGNGAYGNLFLGNVQFSGNNVTIRSDHTINFGTSTATGNLVARSTGDGLDGRLLQSGAITVAGTATLQAINDDITLDNAGNNFATVIITDANNVTLRDANSIELQTTNAIGSLTVTAGGSITDLDNNSGAAILVTNGTTFSAGADVILNDVDNDYSGSVSIASANNATLVDTTSLSLGNINVSGALNVAADDGITQAASTGLIVGSAATFSTSSSNADINLNSTSNNLQGTINLSTTGGNTGDITLNNTATTTILGAVSAYGNLTVSADHDLIVAGTTSVTNNVGGTNSRTMQLNFGQAVSSSSTFSLNTGAAISTSTGTDDTVNITINSGNNANTFNFAANSQFSTTTGGTITVNGGSAIDTFNIATSIAGTFNAGNSNDNFNINAPSLTITSLRGDAGTDTLTGYSLADNTWNITGAGTGNINGAINFQAMENFTGGNQVDTFNIGANVAGNINSGAGADVFNINNAGITVASINGGTDADTLNAANEANYWSVIGTNTGTNYSDSNRTVTRLSFADVETLNGNSGIDDFAIGASGSINAINGGAGAGTNTLRARQGVDNVWNFTTLTSGSLALASSPSVPYVTTFNNIQNFVGGGAGNEWANFSSTNGLNINVGSYLGFTGIIGGNNSTLNGENILNTWTIGTVNDPNNILNTNQNDGRNDGTVTTSSGTLSFVNFATLMGGTNIDNFIITDSGSVSVINGGGGSGINSLTGRNADSTWNVTGADSGNVRVTGSALYVDSFLNIQQINGGSGVDNITVSTTGSLAGGINAGDGGDVIALLGIASIAGVIDGGAGSDTLDLANSDLLTVELGNRTTANLNVYRMESINGNAATVTNNTLIGDNTHNIWTIDAVNGGDVNDPRLSNTITRFTNFANISGGSDVDEVNIYSNIRRIDTGNGADIISMYGGNVSTILLGNGDDRATVQSGTVGSSSDITTGIFGDAGNDRLTVNGGTVSLFNGGANFDTVAYNSAVQITVGGNLGIGVAVDNVEEISAVNGTLNARSNVATTWTIDGINSGSVFDDSDPAQILAFSGFNTLNGGSGDDNFTVTRNTANNTYGSVTGSVNGNGGINTLSVELTGTESGQINYYGTTGSDTVTVAAGTSGNYSAVYNPEYPSVSFDQLLYTSGSNISYAVNYSGVDTVNTQLSLDLLTINSTPATDAIILGNNIFTVGARTPVGYGNVSNIAVNATGDNVEINNLNLPGTLTLNGGVVADAANSSLVANRLILNNGVQFGSASNLINTSIDTLEFSNAGLIYIDELNGLNINTAGTVENTGIFQIGGTTVINAGGGSLTLNNALNDFDVVNVSNANSITLADANSINNGLIVAGTVNLNTVNGVGVNVDNRLQTQTNHLTISNSASGGVYVQNNQAATFDIVNLGDIDVLNTSGDVVINRLYTNGGNYDPAISTYTGNVYLNVQNGNFMRAYTGQGAHSEFAAPDIVAENLTILSQGTLGSPDRYMSVRVNDTFTFVGISGFVHYYGERPQTLVGVDDLVDFSTIAAGLFNQQLVEVESLTEIDPAIFTAVRNYNYNDISIRMPSDQLFEDEETEQ